MNIVNTLFEDVLIIVFIMTFTDPIRDILKRIFGMVVTLFFAVFNRITLYTFPQKDIQENDTVNIWDVHGSSSFNASLLTVFGYSPAQCFPDYMLSLFSVNKALGYLVPIEIFIRQGIFMAIVQSSLYFYYTSFYVTGLNKLKEEPELYTQVAKE